MARVFAADYAHNAVALYNSAILTYRFDRRSYFHFFISLNIYFSVLAAPNNSTLREVVRAHFQLDGIARNDLDIVHAEFARYVRRDDEPVGKLNFERCVGEGFHDDAFRFDYVVF